jgi:hypothetical protein
LLVIMSALGIIMVLTVSPDMMINGYYGNYRGSYYAADSGMNIARQQLINNTVAAFNMTPCTGWVTNSPPPCDQPPLQGNTGTTVMNGITTTYGSFSSLQAGQAVNSWPENFELANTAAGCNTYALAAGYPITTQNAQGQNNSYTYRYDYNLCALGRAQASQQVVTTETGSLVYTISAQTSGSTTQKKNFASYGYFIDNFPPCDGPLVPGTMTGEMFTNGAWQFGTSGAYIFTDPVSQQNAKADYWFGNKCIQSPTTQYTSGGQTIKPTFQQGLNLGQSQVAAPSNDFSQKWAALDGLGCGENNGSQCGNPSSPPPLAPTNADLNSHLKNINGTAYPSGGAISGVYMPYSCTGGPPCVNTINGGGIFVEGNASVVLSCGTDGSGHPTQIYAITQGGTTTTVTTNIIANTTTMTSGGTTKTLAGVPDDLTGASPSPATMLYVDGTITGLRGTGEGASAIQDGTALTIAANGDIDVTGDVLYKTQPVKIPADTLISGNDNNQVLGLYTNTGNIVLSSPYSDKNLQLDASLAALGKGCSQSGNGCSMLVNGCINTINIMGGRISSNISTACVTTRNMYFDRRFTAKSGFAPPWFPSTVITTSGTVTALTPTVADTTQRTNWYTTPQ